MTYNIYCDLIVYIEAWRDKIGCIFIPVIRNIVLKAQLKNYIKMLKKQSFLVIISQSVSIDFRLLGGRIVR